ncbi:pre-rRNA-processing protein TSR1 [Trifolium pratense]|uniref:Pre-rRNA-processing protein TSR1 n=1 Tax=Trifolium pratense TaxID=57577 RepID=A0A2K3NM93_TRIPR|nr:pre-rRNA-processing protein TSR1 [Trifolium pratense]
MLDKFCLSSGSNSCFCLNSVEFDDEFESKPLIASEKDDHKLRLKDVVAGKQTLAFQLKPKVLKAPHGDLISCMEMLKVSILIISACFPAARVGWLLIYWFLWPPQLLYVKKLIRATLIPLEISAFLYLGLYSLGLPSTVLFVRGLPTDLRQRNKLMKICSSSLASKFPEDCRCYPADTQDDLHKVTISPIIG